MNQAVDFMRLNLLAHLKREESLSGIQRNPERNLVVYAAQSVYIFVADFTLNDFAQHSKTLIYSSHIFQVRSYDKFLSEKA